MDLISTNSEHRINLEQVFPAERVEFLRHLGAECSELGTPVYLVGGTVRDLLLNQVSEEVDLMVDGDLYQTLSELEQRWVKLFGAVKTLKIIKFKKYLTAKVKFGEVVFCNVAELDFVGARAERYPSPGAPPLVQCGDLRSDLQRRDFTINALAVALVPESWGEIIDYHGGVSDLKARCLRVIHQRSFIDDPVRMIRGIRFCVRLGFSWEGNTAARLSEAIASNALSTVSPSRVWDEISKAFTEVDVERLMNEFRACGLWLQFFPEDPEPRWSARSERLKLTPQQRRVSAVCELLASLSAEERVAVCNRFGISDAR